MVTYTWRFELLARFQVVHESLFYYKLFVKILSQVGYANIVCLMENVT